MLSKWIIGASLVVVAWVCSPCVADEVKVGDTPPEFSLVGEEADTINLTDFRGKRLVVTFNRANWCPYCMKQIKDLQKHYGDIKDAGAEVLVVFREEATGSEGLEKIRKITGAEMPLALDLEAKKTKDWSVEGYDTYIIDEKGKVTAILQGTKPDRPMGEQILEALK